MTNDEKTDWELAGWLIVAVICVLTLLCIFARPARADVNLPITGATSCVGKIGLAACAGYIYDRPAPNSVVLTGNSTSGVWKSAESVGGAELIMTCGIDIPPGAYNGCKRVDGTRAIMFAPKSTVFAPEAPNTPITIAWDAVTTHVDGSGLIPLETIGYRIYGQSDSLSGVVGETALLQWIAPKHDCYRVSAVSSATGEGEKSAEVCTKDPPKPPISAPQNVRQVP